MFGTLFQCPGNICPGDICPDHFVHYFFLLQYFVDNTFHLRQKFFGYKILWPQKYFGTQNTFRNQNFLEQTFFVQHFFFTNPFGNFFEHSKFYLIPMHFMQHFCGLNILSTRFFRPSWPSWIFS